MKFSLKHNAIIFMNVVCCSRDWPFKGKTKSKILTTSHKIISKSGEALTNFDEISKDVGRVERRTIPASILELELALFYAHGRPSADHV